MAAGQVDAFDRGREVPGTGVGKRKSSRCQRDQTGVVYLVSERERMFERGAGFTELAEVQCRFGPQRLRPGQEP